MNHVPLHVGVEPRKHVRLDQPRRDAVHPDAAAGHLARERARHRDQAAFRRGVIRLTDDAAQSGYRCDVDHGAAPLLEHDGKRGVRQRERAIEIRLHDVFPLLLGHVEHQRVAADPGVVDEPIECPESGHDVVDDRVIAGIIANVARIRMQPLAVGGHEFIGGGF